jgi:preprotein translocase subunit YajC
MSAAVEQLLFFVLLGVAAWLLLVRPQRRRAQALQEARDGIAVGASVITTAGLHATVAALEGDTVLLEIAPGVLSRFATRAVVRVLDPAEGTEAGSGQAAPLQQGAQPEP